MRIEDVMGTWHADTDRLAPDGSTPAPATIVVTRAEVSIDGAPPVYEDWFDDVDFSADDGVVKVHGENWVKGHTLYLTFTESADGVVCELVGCDVFPWGVTLPVVRGSTPTSATR